MVDAGAFTNEALVDIASRHASSRTSQGIGPLFHDYTAPDCKASAALATSHLGLVRIWDPTQPEQPPTELHQNNMVEAVAWSPDGTLLATASMGGIVGIWNPNQPDQPVATLHHRNWLRAVAWSPDGTRLATGGDDGAVQVFVQAS